MSGHLSNLKRRLAAGLLALTTAVGLGGLTAAIMTPHHMTLTESTLLPVLMSMAPLRKLLPEIKLLSTPSSKTPQPTHTPTKPALTILPRSKMPISLLSTAAATTNSPSTLWPTMTRRTSSPLTASSKTPPTPRTPISTTTRAQTNTSTLMRRDTTITTTTVKAPTSTSSTIWTLLKTLHPLLPRN